MKSQILLSHLLFCKQQTNNSRLIQHVKFSIVLIFITSAGWSQTFWQKIPQPPAGNKTGIVILQNANIFVSSQKNIFKSTNSGTTWTALLTADSLYSLFGHPSGRLLAGSAGKIYISENFGSTWNVSQINQRFQIRKVVAGSNGHIYAMANIEPITNTTYGKLFTSTNGGTSWQDVSPLADTTHHYSNLDIDKNNRVYLTAEDENYSGMGGLYYSDNNGANWNKAKLVYSGQNIIADSIRVSYSSNMNVSCDSVYWSVEGVAVNVAARLNLRKHISDINNATYWQFNAIVNTWWQDKAMCYTHKAANNDTYSSSRGSTLVGGTFFKPVNAGWQKQISGLQPNQYNAYSAQYFAETPNGKIYMIQLADTNIYYTSQSLATTVAKQTMKTVENFIFPNMVHAGDMVSFKNPLTADETENLWLIETNGTKRKVELCDDHRNAFYAPSGAGIYFLQIISNHTITSFKLVVY